MVDDSLDRFFQQIDYSIDLFGYGFELLYLHIARPISRRVSWFRCPASSRLRGLDARCSLPFGRSARILGIRWGFPRTAPGAGRAGGGPERRLRPGRLRRWPRTSRPGPCPPKRPAFKASPRPPRRGPADGGAAAGERVAEAARMSPWLRWWGGGPRAPWARTPWRPMREGRRPACLSAVGLLCGWGLGGLGWSPAAWSPTRAG